VFRGPAGRLAVLILVIAAATVPSGCGFRLRGAVEIPPQVSPMYVESRGASSVRQAVWDRLELSAVTLAPTAKEARVVVRILGESRRSRVAAVDRDGKVVASELFLTVTFDAIDGEGRPLFEAQTLDLSRTYENPDVEVLGKQLEAELIYEDLTQDAADRILDRLRAAFL
jgi:LPS-assembly lipoprotein